jgi:hypothetical protein
MSPATANKKWCPKATAASIVAERPFSAKWKDRGHNNNLLYMNKTEGISISVASVNRDASGNAHPDCMCIADDCMMWAWRSDDEDDGFCTLFHDNVEDDQT